MEGGNYPRRNELPSTRIYALYNRHPMSQSLTDLPRKQDPITEDGRYDKLVPLQDSLNRRIQYAPAQFTRNDSSESDSSSKSQLDSTHPARSFTDILSRFSERTSCVGPPYINSSRHFYSKFFWTILFIGMILASIINVYFNIETFQGKPIKTKVSIGYAPLVFPTVTICNTNPLRKSKLNLASEDLQEFLNLQDPSELENSAPFGMGSPNTGQSGPTQTDSSNNLPSSGGPDTASSTNNSPTSGGTTTQDSNTSQNGSPKNGSGQNVGPDGQSRSKRFVDQYQQKISYGNKTFRPPIKDFGNPFGGEKDARYESEEEFSYLIGLEDANTRYKMSHQIDDMLLSCSIEGRSCEAGNFTSFLTDDYGVCYSYNQITIGGEDLVRLRRAYRRGNTYGLQLMLFLEVGEYIPGVTLGYGARISIDYPTTMPFPDVDGLYISASRETDIGVKMINISRLGEPYAVCADPASFLTNYGYEYTRQACQSVCPHNLILEYCNCYNPSKLRLYPFNTTEKYSTCNSSEALECMGDVEHQFSVEETLSCDCPNPCQETTYDLRLSNREWPEDTYMFALIDKVCRMPGNEATCNTIRDQPRSSQRRNFLKVNVFYRDLNFETLEEEPDYPESQFLSDIGGSIGLWVGLSVLSIAEVLELAFEIIVWLFRRCCQGKKKSRNNQESKAYRDRTDTNETRITSLYDGVSIQPPSRGKNPDPQHDKIHRHDPSKILNTEQDRPRPTRPYSEHFPRELKTSPSHHIDQSHRPRPGNPREEYTRPHGANGLVYQPDGSLW